MSEKNLTQKEFSSLPSEDISRFVKDADLGTVAFMMDGTRRLLKTKPEHRDDDWLYHKEYITKLIIRSLKVAELFYEYGVDNIIGPLISQNNLDRQSFFPVGALNLIEPLASDYAKELYKKWGVRVVFYGNKESYRNRKGAQEIINLINNVERMTTGNKDRKMLIGVGFNTIDEEKLISDMAITYYKKTKKNPSLRKLKEIYYGVNLPEIGVFIRTNEIRVSGGFPPLLSGPRTQLYFPVSPGIISMNRKTIKKILYDYLFNRVLSYGKHAHKPISSRESQELIRFYENNQEVTLGVGRRIGDVWVSDRSS